VPTVTCGNCGRLLDERSDIPAEERLRCPVCGSRARVFTATGGVASAVAIAATPSTVVEDIPANQAPEAEALRGLYQVTLEWHSLEGGLCWLRVLNVYGEYVEGGVGDSPEDALLEVYERLIPPT
jgi:hypothetical protein